MDIRQLEYFSEVAKYLSFTKASASLHVSQPSISKAIKNLEDELGVPLFYRSPKQLELTDAGNAVLTNVKIVLESFNNLTTELTDIIDFRSGEIKIGIPPIIGAAFFSKLISQFKEAYPSIEIMLTEVGTKKIIHELEDGSIDIGLVCNIPKTSNDFEMVKLVKDPLMVIVHKNHEFASKQKVNFSELENQAFILYRKDFSIYDRIMEECTKNNFYPNIVCESSQKDFMVEMVEAKLGIALLPSKIGNNIYNNEIKAIPLNCSNLHLELGMAWKKNKYLSFAVREFISMSKKDLTLCHS
ncbi:LysR family transcriptional regulator [Halalkalibacter kiskunsagensis]|uniref:LysR family transcriptional regulator n=1 Tax=Halalkalibacter kiskunsagensis TaxID=1548599 RepID=A0ABV6KAW2_9BACI